MPNVSSNPLTTPPTAGLRYLALGDSYTIGESVPPDERWPVQLAARLSEAGLPLAAPEIIARTGWTTDELGMAIKDRAPQGPYELVTLLIGVNNQYRGRAEAEYQQQFQQLLDQAVKFAGGDPQRVIVVSIPDWGVTPFAQDRDRDQIAAQIDAFNALNRAETEAAGARYVDITPLSRQAAEQVELTTRDGLHPSGEMYSLWVELILPEAVEALSD